MAEELPKKLEEVTLEDEEVLDLKAKKKKKKKDKKADEDQPPVVEENARDGSPSAAATATVDQDEEEFMKALATQKKKTKKRQPTAATGGDGVAESAGASSEDAAAAATASASATSSASSSDKYTYAVLLERVFSSIRAQHPELAGAKKKYTLKPPNVVKDGTKKSAFTNFYDICKSMGRSQEHLLAFVLAELGTSGSIDSNNCLILKGKYQSKHIEGLLRKYITEYVQCSMCHSLDTKLEKDQTSRLYQMSCNSCKASRTVSAITGGFKAQIGKRKKM